MSGEESANKGVAPTTTFGTTPGSRHKMGLAKRGVELGGEMVGLGGKENFSRECGVMYPNRRVSLLAASLIVLRCTIPVAFLDQVQPNKSPGVSLE